MNKLQYPFFVMFFLFSTALFAQTSTNSPFSRFGLGDLSSSYSASQSSMGGSSVVYSDHMSINSNNPATYSLLRPKSLLLSTSLIFQNTESSTNQLSQTKNNTNIGHISLAMPLNKNLFLSSGLLPYSHVGYMMEETEFDPIYGNANYFYQGYGGINNYYLGISAKLHDNISVGINASYLFGGLNRDKDIDFNDPYSILEAFIKDGERYGYEFPHSLDYYMQKSNSEDYILVLLKVNGNLILNIVQIEKKKKIFLENKTT